MSQAVRVALRRLRDTPGFTAIALASLAFGMGLNILIFSLTSPVLFKAMPYPEPDRLLDVSMAPPGKPESRGPLTPPLYVLLRDRSSAAFEAVGVFDAGRSGQPRGRRWRRRGTAGRAPDHGDRPGGVRRQTSAWQASDRRGRSDRRPAHHASQLPSVAASVWRPCGRRQPDRAGRRKDHPHPRRHARGLRTLGQFFRRLVHVRFRTVVPRARQFAWHELQGSGSRPFGTFTTRIR